MNGKLTAISASNELTYYTDEKNIPAQDKFVIPTIEYFKTGAGARAFKPLEFLNLLEKQHQFVVSNIGDSEKVISHLKALPLTELEKHILFGLLLKWFGGYPVHNSNDDFDRTLKLIENEFLNYEGETPEKEFCKADLRKSKQFNRLSIALTNAINNDLDANQIYEAMEELEVKERTYNSFSELFADAARSNALGNIENHQQFIIEQSRYNYLFNVWLQETKGWEYGNERQYQTFLTKDYFDQFLGHCKTEHQTKTFLQSQTSNEAFQAYNNNYNRLRERFRIKRKATKEDSLRLPHLNEGDVVEYDPEYKTSAEAFALLTNYYAAAYLELEKYSFVRNHKVWNEATIKAEIKDIENFIDAASKENVKVANLAFHKWGTDKPEFIYLRLKNGFYEHLEIEYYPSISAIGNEEARVYGRYFLFYSWLKERLAEFQKPENWKIIATERAVLRNEDFKPIIEMMALHDFLSVAAPSDFATKENGEKIEIKRTRLAENENDFDTICQREFERRNLKNEPAVWFVLYNEVLSHIQELKQLHKERTNFDKNRDFHLLALADTFSQFVQEQANGFGTNKKESETAQPELSGIIKKETPEKFTAGEYALAYIFDLYANGQQIPQNRVEGSLDKKGLMEAGNAFGLVGDTFYRAVMKITKSYDLNKLQHLEAISQRWVGVLKALSKDWDAVSKYLSEKQLLGE